MSLSAGRVDSSIVNDDAISKIIEAEVRKDGAQWDKLRWNKTKKKVSPRYRAAIFLAAAAMAAGGRRAQHT